MKPAINTTVQLRAAATLLPADAPWPASLPPAERLVGTDDASLKRHIARRGIRFKDAATRHALAVATRVLADAGWNGVDNAAGARCAVVAGSCFGNVDTVVRTARALAQADSGQLSPMDLPNASANVLASSLAIWFALRGPNLFLASGAPTGFDLVGFAINLLQAGRCDHVLVVAAESEQPDLPPWFERSGPHRDDPMPVATALLLQAGTPALRRDRGGAPLPRLVLGESAAPGRRTRRLALAEWRLPQPLRLRAHAAAPLLALHAAARELHGPDASAEPWPGLRVEMAPAPGTAPGTDARHCEPAQELPS
jgi:hypothetical protein